MTYNNQTSGDASIEPIALGVNHFGTIINFGIPSNHGDDFQFEEGTALDDALDELGVTSIRFPAGNEVWDGSFDYTNSDHIEALHDVIDYCAENGLNLNFTLSARQFIVYGDLLSKYDDTFSISESEENYLSKFIEEELIGYANTNGVKIESIKIGNEFLSGTEDAPAYSAKLYGQIASEMVQIVGSTLDEIADGGEHPRPQIVIEDAQLIDGAIEIASAFDDSSAAYVDAIDIHRSGWTLQAPLDRLAGGSDSEQAGWISERTLIWQSDDGPFGKFGDLDIRLDAWSLPIGSETGSSLENAGSCIMQLYNFSKLGITSASAWTGFGWIRNTLWHPNEGITPAGNLFSSLTDTLFGKTAVDLNIHGPDGEPLNEIIEIRSFEDNYSRAIYGVNMGDEATIVQLDVSDLLPSIFGLTTTDFSVGIRVLGVGDDESAFDSNAESNWSSPFDVDTLDHDSILTITLGPHEVLEVVVEVPNLIIGDDQPRTRGTDNDDIIVGSDSDDRIYGWKGNDIIIGGEGNDVSFGHKGDDVFIGGDGVDAYWGGSGRDTVSYEDSEDSVRVDIDRDYRSDGGAAGERFYSVENVIGSSQNDAIFGDYKANTLDGLSGNDSLDGRFGDDLLYGREGDDSLRGGLGHDTLFGGDGNDLLVGGGGNDLLVFAGGMDTFFGGEGSDVFLVDPRPLFEDGEHNSLVLLDFDSATDKLQFGWIEDGKIVDSDLSSLIFSVDVSSDKLLILNSDSQFAMTIEGLDPTFP